MKIRIKTRIVLVLNKKVIKIPISYKGYNQSKNERDIWYKYKNNILGKIYWYKFGLVCMKRYRRAKQIPFNKIIEAKNKIPELNTKNSDLHIPDNWGFQYGNYYIIDYGIKNI